MIKKLYNKKSKNMLIENLEAETFNRITCSFYNYINIYNPSDFRDKLYSLFHTLNTVSYTHLTLPTILLV